MLANPKDGKLNFQQLKQQFISKNGYKRENVIQGPAVGVDVSVIKIDEKKGLIVASDPLSIIPSLPMEVSAWLSVHLMANDIATSGFLPEYGQFVLQLPTSLSPEQVTQYWDYIHRYCIEIGIHITGGHTAFDSLSESTLAGGGTLFSIGTLSEIKTSTMAQPDDDLLMTKGAALSSAALLAISFPNYVSENLGKSVLKRAQQSFFLTSILPEVRLLKEDPTIFNGIRSMHDVTEKGIIGASYEFAEASGNTLVLFKEEIIVDEPQQQVCALFGIDPLISVGAGSLLIACRPDITSAVKKLLRDNNIAAAQIGKFQSSHQKQSLIDSEGREIPYPAEDPYWGIYLNNVKRGRT